MNKINLSIDCVVLSFDKDQKLKVLLIKKYINSKNDYQFALPGDLLRIDEDVLCGAKRILKSLTSLENIYLKQFAVFGHPDRTKNKKDQQWLKLYRKNPNERVVTIGYVALVNIADFLPKPSLFAVEAEWVELSAVSNQLAFDHNKIINEAVEFLKDNLDYIPPFGKGSMYVRPVCFGTSKAISVQPATEYMFIVFASPVGPYFKTGSKPLHLFLSNQFHRAAPKGIGNAKAIGNYSASLLPQTMAKSQGYNDMIYVHAKNEQFIEEMGAANLFVVSNGELLTPKLGGSILDGVTRDSVIKIARDLLNLNVHETDIDIDTLLNAEEVFCCGTAVTVTGVGKISTAENEFCIGDGGFGEKTMELKKLLLGIQNEEIDDPFGWIFPID